MPIYRGTKNLTLFLGSGKSDGTSNVRVYLGDKLVYAPFRPPEGDLLLAGPSVYLKAGAEVYLDYKNQPLLRQDSLSHQTVGNFSLSFALHSGALRAGSQKLLALAGLAEFWNRGGQLLVKWGLGDRFYSVPAEALKSGWNELLLRRQAGKVVLQVNTAVFTLFNANTQETVATGGWFIHSPQVIRTIFAKGE